VIINAEAWPNKFGDKQFTISPPAMSLPHPSAQQQPWIVPRQTRKVARIDGHDKIQSEYSARNSGSDIQAQPHRTKDDSDIQRTLDRFSTNIPRETGAPPTIIELMLRPEPKDAGTAPNSGTLTPSAQPNGLTQESQVIASSADPSEKQQVQDQPADMDTTNNTPQQEVKDTQSPNVTLDISAQKDNDLTEQAHDGKAGNQSQDSATKGNTD
jgi:hypothetical protein